MLFHDIFIKAMLVMQLGFPGGSVVKNLPAMQETWVWSLDWEDSWEKEMATHSSILACRIPWTEEPAGLQSSCKESNMTEYTHRHSYVVMFVYSFVCLIFPLSS